MLPVIALIGRPNVGKSTLFNRLTRSRDAIVDDQPGVTRDRLYGKGKVGSKGFLVVDTGGLEPEFSEFSEMVAEQVNQVIEESNLVFFVVDSIQGLVPQDREIAELLRKSNREIYLLVNKMEGRTKAEALSEFSELGIGEPVSVSARRGDGVSSLIEKVLSESTENDDSYERDYPRVAIVGRPNVGKSTLTNRLCGKNRVIVSDIPGTTRDSVLIPLQVNNKRIDIIDTAGVRRKSKLGAGIEQFSVVKTLQAVEKSNVVILVLDGSTDITFQDAAIAGIINDLGRSIVLVVNKWDGLGRADKNRLLKSIENKLPFLNNPETVCVSALHGSSCNKVMPAVDRAYNSAMVDIATSSLNRSLMEAIDMTPPPTHNQRPVKLKFAHQAGKNPPVIVIHGNLAKSLPTSYLKYLSRFFSRKYRLVGTPVRIIGRSAENPYHKAGSKTKLVRRNKQ